MSDKHAAAYHGGPEPEDVERDSLARLLVHRMPPVLWCCSGALHKSEGHDQNPPCATVARAREVADAIIAAGFRRREVLPRDHE